MILNKITSWEDYQLTYKKSIDSPEDFWSEIAESFIWQKKWDSVLQWNFQTPLVEWFKGGKLNITVNALDRHVKRHPDKIALIWEPNDPITNARKFTYKKLLDKVCIFKKKKKKRDYHAKNYYNIHIDMFLLPFVCNKKRETFFYFR